MNADWNGLVAFLPTSDLEATHIFYHQILGMPLHKDQGKCRIYQVGNDSYVGFCTHFPQSNTDGMIITLLTDEVDEKYKKLSAHSEITVESPPQKNEQFKIYHFYARDPNGYKVEIQKFLD